MAGTVKFRPTRKSGDPITAKEFNEMKEAIHRLDNLTVGEGLRILKTVGAFHLAVDPIEEGCEAQNEVQSISLIGPPTGGTWGLYILGILIGGLDYDISAIALQALIEATPPFSVGDVEVTSSGGFGYNIEFKENYKEIRIAVMIGDTRSLEGLGVGIIIIANQRGRDGS